MPKCVYCGKEYEFPRGVTFVMNDGRIQYLCSSKCRKNMVLKKRKIRWIRKELSLEKKPRKEINK